MTTTPMRLPLTKPVSNQPTPPPAADTDAGADSTANSELTVTMSDMFFDPDRIQIPAETDIRVTWRTSGGHSA